VAIEETELTALLSAWRAGEAGARDRLSILIYDQLKGLAYSRFAREGSMQTLQPTALVHEALMRLWQAAEQPQNRAHLFALAALHMRSILIDYARAKGAERRGGNQPQLTLERFEELVPAATSDFLELEEALCALEREEPRAAEAITLSYFGGLSQEEIAEYQGASLSTVERSLRFGKAWLRREFGG